MRSFLLIGSLAFVAHAGDSLDKLLRKFTERLFDKALKASPHTNLDTMTLGKPMHLAVHSKPSTFSHQSLATKPLALHLPAGRRWTSSGWSTQWTKAMQHPHLPSKPMNRVQSVQMESPPQSVGLSTGPASEGEATEDQGSAEEDKANVGSTDEDEAIEGAVGMWNAFKGYGFITPVEGGDQIFFHASSLVDGDNSVQPGDMVKYVKGFNDARGEHQAMKVQVIPGENKNSKDPERGRGFIVNWNSQKGFGFIQPADGGENLFLHITNLVDEVQQGDWVTFTKSFNTRSAKFQAADCRLDPLGAGTPMGMGNGFGEDALDKDEKREYGQVKFWNDEKGFGFIQPNDRDPFGDSDVFVHATELLDGVEGLYSGDEVSYVKAFNSRSGKYNAKRVRIDEDPNYERTDEGDTGDPYAVNAENTRSWDEPDERTSRYKPVQDNLDYAEEYKRRSESSVDIGNQKTDSSAQTKKFASKWGDLFASPTTTSTDEKKEGQ
eukprot:gnl/MRDRNA2_/MRDRNA2_140097_c0_seq1.p1 gnl/MRDRNA2_/MRDRNA2_140097_c0~~gnl/MRDRNA2_/MRDRNA2_140097_c0_seq1.p1  ORF type:complete len:493 (-),score=87.97 gnl/MRDRNA2_/MRDRNA2_140097_c0_seq1:49-1527(-)